jgi:hypothetical protein
MEKLLGKNMNKGKSGIVVNLSHEMWLKIEQMILDYKKEGIKVTKSELTAHLVEEGYLRELERGTRIGI